MSADPGPKSRSPSMRGAPSCSVLTTSRCPTSAILGPLVPSRTLATSESPILRTRAVLPPSLFSTASHNALSSPMGEGIEQSQRSVSARRVILHLYLERPSHRNREIAQRIVERDLAIGGLAALADDQ